MSIEKTKIIQIRAINKAAIAELAGINYSSFIKKLNRIDYNRFSDQEKARIKAELEKAVSEFLNEL